MKIKVHAQRKFAQGAFIPPSVSAAPAERRGDVTPSKEENKHVYYNRMSAVSLLDIVAFQNMHSHSEPVVLLERLEEIQETMTQPLTELDGAFASPIKNATTNGTANHTKSKLAKPLRYIRPKRTMGLNQRAQRPQNMHLRSRLGSSFKPKSRAVKKKCREKPSGAARPLRRRRVPSPAESYDLDDDKPLTYIAQVLRRTVALRSDRNLRKRRGEELASTSKTALSKAEHTGSDSDDTDTGAASGPTKPKQSNGLKTSHNTGNGHKLNDDGGKVSTSLPSRSVGTNDLSTHTQSPRNTPQVRPTIRKDEIDLKGTSRVPTMVKSNKLSLKNRVNTRTRLNVQSNDLEFKGGSRGRRIIQKYNRNVKGTPLPQTAIQNNAIKLRTDLPTQSTIQSKEVDTRHSVHAQETTKNNNLYPKNSTEAQHTSKTNDLNLRSSVPCQPMGQNSDLEHRISSQVQTTGRNKDSDPKNNSQGPLTIQSNGLKLRSSWRAQQAQNNDLKPRSSFQPAIQSKELDLGGTTQVQLVSQIDFERKSSPAQSTSYSNDLSITLVQPTYQNNDLKLRSTGQAQPTLQSGLKTRSSPINENNNANSKISQAQVTAQCNNLKLRSSLRNQSTGQNNNPDFQGGSLEHTTSQNNDITSVQTQRPSSQNDLSKSLQVGPSQNNDLDIRISTYTQPMRQNNNLKLRSSLRTQQSSHNNNIKLGDTSQAQSLNKELDSSTLTITSQNNNIQFKSSVQSRPTSDNLPSQHNGIDFARRLHTQQATQNNYFNLQNVLLTQTTTQNNDMKNTSQAQPMSLNNDFNHKSNCQAPSTSQNNDVDPRNSSRAQPTRQINSLDDDVGRKNSAQANPNSLDHDVGRRNSSQANSTSIDNDFGRRNSSQANSTSLDNNFGRRISSQADSTSLDNDVGRRNSSQANPTNLGNDFSRQNNLQANLTNLDNDVSRRNNSQANSTSLDNNVGRRNSSQANPTNLDNDVSRRNNSQANSTSLDNDVGRRNSSQANPTNLVNDVSRRNNSQANSTSLDNDVGRRNSSQANSTNLGNDFSRQNNLQANTTNIVNDVGRRNNSEAIPTILNNDTSRTNSSQANSTSLNSDVDRINRSQTQITTPNTNIGHGGSGLVPPSPLNNQLNPRDGAQTLPTIQNRVDLRTSLSRLGIPDNDLELGNNLLAQLMLQDSELDLIMNSRPLSAIQNYDWSLGSFRSRPTIQTLQNNFLGRTNFRPRATVRNDNVQQRPDTRVQLSVRNDLELGGNSQALPPVRNIDVEREDNSTRQRNTTHESPNSTAQAVVRSGDDPIADPRTASNQTDHTNVAPGARPASRNMDLGLGDSSRPRPTIRSDTSNVGGGWGMRAFRNHSFHHRPRSTLLNDEIGPRARPRLTAHSKLDHRGPPQSMRDHSRLWNAEANGERSREQQLRVDSLAAASRASAKAERMAAVAADRERAMTLDEALRECVLTAQSVTAEEVKRMQRRQAIAARQQQLSEGSPPSRRIAARRTLHTDTTVNGHPRASERELVVSPQRTESESEPEPGPSKPRRKKLSSPGDTGSDSQARSSESEPEARKEPQPDSDPGSSKIRRKKPTTPEDPTASQRSPDREAGPSKRRRKKTPSLISGPQDRPSKTSELTPKTTNNNTDSSMTSASSQFEPANVPAVSEIPADLIGKSIIMGSPRVGLWSDNMLMPNFTDQELPHFKVPRIPVARKSIERRIAKLQGNERDDMPTSLTTEPNATTTQIDQEEPKKPTAVLTPRPKGDTLPFPCREELAEPIIQPKNACLSKHYTTVRTIVLATDSELAERCGNCIYCTRVEKIRKLSNLVQNQRKVAATTNEVYDFDADKEDSHENTRLYNFRQNRKAKLLEPGNRQDAPKDPVYLDVLPPQNQHIIEITSVQMPNQNKPMLRARLIRKTDANLENEFSLIEHENLLDQLLEIKIANSDQAAKKTTVVETEEPVAGPSNAEPVQAEVTDSADDVELNYETDDSTEFLARLQTRLNTRKKTEQTSLRAKASEKASLSKKTARTEAKKLEPVRKAKALRKGQESMQAELPKIYMSGNFSHCFREAPIFHPTEQEFLDPLAYFEKIYPVASQFGLCKVVAPAGFKPKCTITDDVRFNVANQYISRLYCRWGAASKEMCAIKAYLAEQKVFFTRPPLIEGIELNLPKLYRTVQRHGGLKKVIEKKRWGRVAEDMQFPRGPRSAKRIDQLYVKHLLPYDTLSSAERRELMDTVEHSWSRNYKKMLNRASNPLHRQKRLMGESESSDEVDTDEDANLAYALAEAEDCVVTGRCMKLSVFKKVASNVLCTLFPHTPQPTPEEVEQEYWTLVAGAAEHVCVNAASIDTGEEGYGFPRAKHDPYSKHPWNLKMFSQNSGNVLRSLGPVLGVTVPTLHLGMVFATSCWHRDPHGLPWLEYMHHGPPKIWYGIPDELSAEFRKAVETLCPTSCQNKSIWLPSDITMIPPHLLHSARVPLSRVVQKPGEFIVVCPKAYSSSIATGYTESESVYFAPAQWLTDVSDVFQELRASCEPTMFSLSQLLLAVAMDARTPLPVLAGVSATLRDVVAGELGRRDALERCGIELCAPEQNRASCNQARKRPAGAWNVREQDECEVCRTTLYLSKVTGLTSKRSSLCLEHALLLIDKDKKRYARSVGGVVATIFVLRAELEDAVRRVERRLCQ